MKCEKFLAGPVLPSPCHTSCFSQTHMYMLLATQLQRTIQVEARRWLSLTLFSIDHGGKTAGRERFPAHVKRLSSLSQNNMHRRAAAGGHAPAVVFKSRSLMCANSRGCRALPRSLCRTTSSGSGTSAGHLDQLVNFVVFNNTYERGPHLNRYTVVGISAYASLSLLMRSIRLAL